MDKIKLGIWGDAVVPTGFSRVLHSITKYLPEEDYDIFWIGVNYTGDPHPYKSIKIYPAGSKSANDPYGFTRVKDILKLEKPDMMFLLNDAWILNQCLDLIKNAYKEEESELPKIVTYIPVDALDHNPAWYKNFDIVSRVVAYTNFGKAVIKKADPTLNISIIQHGVDNNTFFKLDESKNDLKRKMFNRTDDFYDDSFVVLNANRNQPRKRIDLTMQGFTLFAKDKPANVKLYLHMGIEDMHMNIISLAVRYGIDSRLLISNHNKGVQTVNDTVLNAIYNSCDVGINTCIGEGWGLPNCEHASIGAPQVVAGHSALKELYSDCGLLIPVSQTHVLDKIMTTGYIVNPVDVADKLNELYENKDLYNKLSQASIDKFSDPKYSWKVISGLWDNLFKEIINGDNIPK